VLTISPSVRTVNPATSALGARNPHSLRRQSGGATALRNGLIPVSLTLSVKLLRDAVPRARERAFCVSGALQTRTRSAGAQPPPPPYLVQARTAGPADLLSPVAGGQWNGDTPLRNPVARFVFPMARLLTAPGSAS